MRKWGIQLICLVLLGWALLPARVADAAGGSWGAGHYPYRAGLVCTSGTRSAPLASWDLGAGAPGFLLSVISSSGQLDSAAPPLPSVGQQLSTPVTPGMAGFSSDADIAAFAALLSGPGAGTDDAMVAAVAREVLLHAGATDAPSCASAGTDLLTEARERAGPYTVRLHAAQSPAVMNAPDTLLATVRGGSGQPVPGMRVTLTASGAQLASKTATTDADGTARVRFTVPTGSALARVAITAQVSAPTGLEQVSVLGRPTPTNPRGSSVPAIRVAAPVTVSAVANVAVDQSAHPAVTVDSDVAAVHGAVHPRATVRGLRGHRATVTVTVRGPVQPDHSGSCGAVPDSAPLAATTGPATVTGDQTVQVGSWSPAAAGCYGMQANVDTLDATPVAHATGRGVLTVITTSARIAVPHPIVGAGRLTATLTPAHTNGHGGQIDGRLLGPLRPDVQGSCAGLDWSQAPTAAQITSGRLHGDQPVVLRSAAVHDPGCYAWAARLDLALGDDQVPVPAPGVTVLLVRPTIALTTDQTWSISPRPIATHVTVTGIYRQAAHVSVQMRHVPTPLLGCGAASWAHAVVVSTGPSVAVRGVGEFAVPSGPTPQNGCYQPVPVLHLDANPAVGASGAAVVADNAVVAGIDLADPTAAPQPRPSAGSALRWWVTGGITGAIEIAVVLAAAIFARRDRGGGREAGLDLLVP